MALSIQSMAQNARAASFALAAASLEKRNQALDAIASLIETKKAEIMAANALDVEDAIAAEVSAPLISRLRVTEQKCQRMADGLRALAALPDPLGRVDYAKELSPGLRLYRVACPIGVIGVIFESRPDALVQIASLCLKSGNAVLLKGGREAARTNELLAGLIESAARECGLPEHWCGLLHSRRGCSGNAEAARKH